MVFNVILIVSKFIDSSLSNKEFIECTYIKIHEKTKFYVAVIVIVLNSLLLDVKQTVLRTLTQMDNQLQIIDYIMLGLTLFLSIAIGLYYAIFKKQNTPMEYLHGGKNMSPIAVALSIVSSILSGIVMTAVPADTYYYGIQIGFLQIPCGIIANLISYFGIMPIFYKLQVTSIYHYLELRFNSKIRKLASFIFTFQIILQIPLVLYVTILVITQIINININELMLIICAICTIYTVFGGIKAVIWTDAIQFCIMLGSIVTVLIIGIISVGGFQNLFNIPYETGRIKMDFDLDMTKRDTVLAITTGLILQLIGLHGLGQGTVQKMLCLKDYQDIKRVHVLSTISWGVIFALSTLTGIMVVTRYVLCDPLTVNKIRKPDQLMPYAVTDMTKQVPGLLGVYVAGIISAGLSTYSAYLNCLSATIYNDFLKNILPKTIIRKHETFILKLIALLVGIVGTALTYVVEYLGNIFPLLINILALTVSPIVGIFFVGLFLPIVNSKGALYGGILTVLILSWLILTAYWYKINDRIRYPTLPTFTNSCELFNITKDPISNYRNVTNVTSDDSVPSIYKISHYYYHPIGVVLVVIISYIISFLTRKENYYVKDEYLSPLVQYIRRKRKYPKYDSVALN